MASNRTDGLGQKITGFIKDALGTMTGDTKLQAEGAADMAIGAAQIAVCRANNATRDAVRT